MTDDSIALPYLGPILPVGVEPSIVDSSKLRGLFNEIANRKPPA
jgi:hypothetical protein